MKASTPIRVLVLDDNAEDFLVVRTLLSKASAGAYVLEHAPNLESALGHLAEGRQDVYLVDYRLGPDSGLDFLRKARELKCPAPLILLTGQGDSEVDLEAMTMGAADFLNKNRLEPDLLARSIRYALERAKIQRSLRNSEEFFRAVTENAQDGIAILRGDGVVRYLSPSARRILGYPVEELMGSSFYPLLHAEDVPRVRAMLDYLGRRPGEAQAIEAQVRHKDGSWRIVEALAQSHLFQEPYLQCVVVNYRDVTDRKKSERTAFRLATIVESSEDAIFSVTLEGVVLSWNQAAQRIYGRSPEEAVGKVFSGFLHPGQREEWLAALERVRDGRAVPNLATSHPGKEGGEVRLSLTLSPIRNALGQVTGASIVARDITEAERSKAAKEVLQAERDQLLEQLQLQMERMPIACVLYDQNFHFTYWNPAAEKMFGYSFKEVEGQKGLLWAPEDRPELEEEFRELAIRRSPNHGTTRENIRKDGKAIACEWYDTPLADAEGNFTGILSMAIDVTERRKAEEVRSQLAAILQQTADAVIGADLDARVFSWNRGAERMFGHSLEEISGQSLSLLSPDAHREAMERHFKAVLEGGVVPNHETVWVKKDGSPIDVSITLSTIQDSRGRTIGVSAIARDITERKKAEAATALLASILEQTPDAVIGSDLEGRILSWNSGAEKMYGYSAEEAIGKNASFLEPPDRAEEIDRMHRTVREGSEVLHFETVRQRRDGSLIDVSLTLSLLKDPEGRTTGYSAIARDITERKKAEESLRMHEEQLRLAQKMDAIGRLAGGVAHDFNNLLSVIGGNAEFLLGSLPSGDPHREELEEIQKAVRRGADLTRQLLVFGQKQVSQPQPVNLNELTTEMNRMFKRLIDATIDLAILQDAGLKPILADPGQMQQIILNLVLNARDAMPKGGHLIVETKNLDAGQVEGEGRPTLPPGSYARLSVTDTGTGMAPEVQKHIFEPFFTTKAGKGTGLGLATVYGIVSKWSGHIFVHSTQGMGTTFVVYFPALAAGEAGASKPKQMALLPQGSETLLLAEDEGPVRKILVRSLEKYGYRVLEAGNGIEAVQKAWGYSGPIHLLVTDTVMPKMNGKELADELRKSRPKVKILFISGYPREILSQQGIMGSDIHLLQKPFEMEDLVREIRKILDEK